MSEVVTKKSDLGVRTMSAMAMLAVAAFLARRTDITPLHDHRSFLADG